MTDKITVAILPGFAEGLHHARQLTNTLESAGYKVVDNASSADIIIAHSGGCYLLPEQNRAKAVFHVGYPYWPGRSILRAACMKIADEYRQLPFLYWMRDNVVNVLHMLLILNSWRTTWGYANRVRILQNLPAGQTFVVNQSDSYTQLEALRDVAGANHTYLTLPGYHDDLWDNPKLYVNLLKSVV